MKYKDYTLLTDTKSVDAFIYDEDELLQFLIENNFKVFIAGLDENDDCHIRFYVKKHNPEFYEKYKLMFEE